MIDYSRRSSVSTIDELLRTSHNLSDSPVAGSLESFVENVEAAGIQKGFFKPQKDIENDKEIYPVRGTTKDNRVPEEQIWGA